MKSVPLTVYGRTASRRSGVKSLRGNGRVPAVIYGRKRPQPQNLEIAAKALEDLIDRSASENILVNLTVEGDAEPTRLALVQDVQHHPLSREILHVDFHEVAEDERVTVTVPVEATGEADGVKNEGGTLEHVLFKLKVRALPKDLPEMLVVDVSHLKVGQAIHIGDIKPPEGVQILGDKHISVLAVAAQITEAQEAAATAATDAAVAEPEVLKEKKEEGAAEGEKPAAGKAPEKKADAKAPEKKAEAKK